MRDAQDRSSGLPLRKQIREALAVVWELAKQHPFLVLWPLTLYMRFFERDVLDGWVAEAEQAVSERRS